MSTRLPPVTGGVASTLPKYLTLYVLLAGIGGGLFFVIVVLYCCMGRRLSFDYILSRDVHLDGYIIPAGSHVIPLINSIHMDPKLWVNPEDFNPKRFVDTDGKVKKPEFFMPFGVGRRMCLGDVLARMEIFLFFATIAHTFDVVLPPGDTLPSLKGNVGVTITPANFKVCLKPRPLIPDQGAASSHCRNIGSS